MRDLIRKILREDFDWTDSTQPETEWDKDKYYVLDVTSLSGLKLRETIDDIWDFAYNIDYDVEVGVTYDSVGYIYFEPTDEVPEGYALDWSNRGTEDPTFGGKYQMLSLEEFYHMAYGDEPSVNESFDWVDKVEPIVKNISGLSYALKPKNLDTYNSKIQGWSHLKVLEDDGKYVKFQLCCENGKYRDRIYYGRSSEIRGRMTGTWSDRPLFENLDWVENVGRDREQIMDDLEARIKLMGWDVDLERESERTSHDGQWYFGRFWCGDEFYELYENTIGENEYDYSIHRHAKGVQGFNRSQYYFYNSYDNLTSKELMSKITRIIVNCLDGDSINEDFDWTEDIKSPVDIALEIADQTVVTPEAFMEHPMIEVPFSDLQYSEPKYFPRFHFDNYIKKHYTEDPTVIDDVWKRWNQEIYSRLSSLNESFDWTDSVQSAKPTWEELEVGDTIIYQPKHFKEPRYYTFYGIQDDRLRFRQATDKRGILMNKISYNNLYRDGYIR